MDFTPSRSSQPETREVKVRMVGTGASAPTKLYGQGITISRLGVGNYRLTFAEAPGAFVNMSHGLQAATPANLAGCTVVAVAWDATNKRLDITLYGSTFAVRELAANEWLSLNLTFQASSL